MTRPCFATTVFLLCVGLSALSGQGYVSRFDDDKNGRLNREERKKARAACLKDPTAIAYRQLCLLFSSEIAKPKPYTGPLISPESVDHYAGHSLYDPKIVRTLFIEFEHDDWFDGLSELYKTDVHVPATLIVDGKKYPGVGIQFRGSTSYYMAAGFLKKPFNIKINYVDRKLRLHGEKNLNLLNGNQDESLIREMLFSHVASEFIPTPRVSFVKLVIQGESWGVYQKSQQFDKEFLKDWYGTGRGVRWKPQRNPNGESALRYLGDSVAKYKLWYELMTKADYKAWRRLIYFCKVLNETKPAELPAKLPELLDVDEALWFCALESVFLKDDGYVNQGYDYRLYEDKAGRFHLVPHDNDEILASGGFKMGPALIRTSPLHGAEDPMRPVFSRLLAVPQWRSRYLAHVRTLTTRWLDWKVLGPICRGYHDTIREDVAKDDKKLFATEIFTASLGDRTLSQATLKSQVIERQKYLLSHTALRGPWPVVSDVKAGWRPKGSRLLHVAARVGGVAQVQRVQLWFRTSKRGPYRTVTMLDDGLNADTRAGDGVYAAVTEVPSSAKRASLYVEAWAATGTTFFPEHAEARPLVRERDHSP